MAIQQLAMLRQSCAMLSESCALATRPRRPNKATVVAGRRETAPCRRDGPFFDRLRLSFWMQSDASRRERRGKRERVGSGASQAVESTKKWLRGTATFSRFRQFPSDLKSAV